MQVQFIRTLAKKGMLGRTLMYELTATMIADPNEHYLLDTYDMWNETIPLCTGNPKEGDNISVKVQNLRDGVTITTEWIVNIQHAETAIVEGLARNLNYCRVRDTFDGTPRIVDVE